VQLVLINW